MSINISGRRIKSLPEQVADNRKRIEEIALNKSLYQHIIYLEDDTLDTQVVFSLFTNKAEPMTKADVIEYLESKGFDAVSYIYPASGAATGEPNISGVFADGELAYLFGCSNSGDVYYDESDSMNLSLADRVIPLVSF